MAITTTPQPANLQVEDPGFGRASLRRLDWDTDFFGRAFGLVERVEMSPLESDPLLAHIHLLSELSLLATSEGFEHLTYRPDLHEWHSVHGAEQAGWLLVDVGVDFLADPVKAPGPSPSDIRLSRDDDLPALQDLAATAFVYSRFAVDPFFSDGDVQAFHRQWITNLHGGLAQALLVSESEGQLAGFVSCSLADDKGRIPLIAVAADQRGQGQGRKLVQAALGWFADAGAREVRVKTQVPNIPAVGLYERCGFVMERPELTFTTDLTRMALERGRLQG
jgi:dTDP-4-amino-4,6-dideoxy-D-galactose acyltransferase